jgi:hypothetical protein
MIETVTTVHDWAWPLRVPVKEGDPMPMQLWFLYHANTLIPMKQEQVQVGQRVAA